MVIHGFCLRKPAPVLVEPPIPSDCIFCKEYRSNSSRIEPGRGNRFHLKESGADRIRRVFRCSSLVRTCSRQSECRLTSLHGNTQRAAAA